MHKIANKLTEVHNRLQKAAANAERSVDSIHLLAVSKTRPADDLRAAYQAGQRCFGENYLQEALDKQAQLSDLSIEWHFIGPIQSNKTRSIAEHFDWVHSVDRIKTARRLSEQRPSHLPPLNICLQVNIDGEESKSGLSLEELPEFAQTVLQLPNIQLRGLMAIPAPRADFAQQCQAFQQLHTALADLRQNLEQEQLEQEQLDTLSMGMSADLEAAVNCGSTMVRVGTDIFGPRR